MKLRKNGEPGSLPKEVWWCLASAHEEFAAALTWLVDRSFTVMLGDELDPSDAKLPNSQTALSLGISRGRFEERFIPDTAGKEVPPDEEIRALLHTLIDWAIKEGTRAKDCRSIAHAQHSGRPRKPTPNALSSNARLLANPPKPPGKPGRTHRVDMSDQTLLDKLEARRGSFRSERDALREIVAEYLGERQKHSAGSVGHSLTANLQKRVASVRASVRKSSEK